MFMDIQETFLSQKAPSQTYQFKPNVGFIEYPTCGYKLCISKSLTNQTSNLSSLQEGPSALFHGLSKAGALSLAALMTYSLP